MASIAVRSSAEPAPQQQETIGNTLWTVIDGNRSILIDLQPQHYAEDCIRANDTYECINSVPGPAWLTIENYKIVDNRKSKNITITKTLYHGFPPYIFKQFYELQRFEMSHQGLTHIEKGHFDNSEMLINLNLSHNYIAELSPSIFWHMRKIEVIDLSFNNIWTVPDSTFLRNNLTSLYLHNNNLTAITWDMFNMGGLQHLTLRDNNILFIEWKAYASGLIIGAIDLSNNPLVKSNSSIQVEGLCINIENTGVEEAWILPKMQSLRAENNKISKINLQEEGQTEFQLKSLNLSNNQLESIAPIAQLHHLETLDLSFNRLSTLNATTFTEMPHLRVVSLRNNNLSTVNFRFLLNSFSLEYFDLSYNNLQIYRWDIISPSLQELHLEGNNLTAIPASVAEVAPQLTHIGINDNNWNCNQLTGALVGLRKDGIEAVVNERQWGISSGRNYTGNVKGIRCSSDDEMISIAMQTGNVLDQRIGEPQQVTQAEVENVINTKLADLEKRLMAKLEEMILQMKTDLIAHFENKTLEG